MAEAVPVTAIVLTRDEERNLPACLDSLRRASQVVVVDSGSTDGTIELARSRGCTVVERPWPGYAAQRNWAMGHEAVEREWVLFVDADERVPDDAWEELRRFLVAPGANAGSFRRSVVFLGRQLRHGGFGTARVTRLLRRGKARYAERLVHEHPVVEGGVHRFDTPLLHDDRRPFEVWLARHNEYSTLEARERAGAGAPPPSGRVSLGVGVKSAIRRRIWPMLPARPLLYFVYVYVLRRGFLDGRAGLRIASLYGFQELCVQIKAEALAAAPPSAHP